MLIMWFAPKIATVLDVLSRRVARNVVRRRSALRRQHRHRDALLPDALADHVVRPHDVPRRPAARHAPSAGADRRATITRCRGAMPREQLWPHTLVGWLRSATLAFTVPAAIPYALFIAAGCRSRSRSRSSRRARRSAAADAPRHRRAAGRERPAGGAAHARSCPRSRRRAMRRAA